MLKRGLILVGLLTIPVLAWADAPEGLAYHEWLRQQNEQGNPAGTTSSSAGGNAAEKQFFSPAGGPFQLDYRMQIDFSGLMGRLETLLTSPEWFGDNPDAAGLAAMLRSSGSFNAGQYRESMTIDKDLLTYSIAQDYPGLPADSYKGQYFALPNREFASARYVNSNALFYLGMHNVPQSAMLVLRELAANPQMLESGVLGEIFDEAMGGSGMGPRDLAGAVQMMDSMGVEGMLSNLLTGEVAMAVYGVEDLAGLVNETREFAPSDLHAAVFLGVNDRAAVANMLTSYGADMGLVSSGEAAGWQLFGFAGDETVTLALGPDVLLATTNWQAVNSRMMLRIARLETPAGQYHFQLDLDQLCAMVEPVVAAVEGEIVDMDELNATLDAEGMPSAQKLDSALRYLLAIDEQGGAGVVRLSGYYNQGYRTELKLKPSVFMYGLYMLGRWGGMAAASELGGNDYSGEEYDYEEGEGYDAGEYGAGAAAPPPDETQVASIDGIIPSGEEDLR